MPLGTLEDVVSINIYKFYRRQKFIQENHKERVMACLSLGRIKYVFLCFYEDIRQNKGILVSVELEKQVRLNYLPSCTSLQ